MEAKPKKLSFFDFITSINDGSKGKNLFADPTVEEKAYVPFMVNRGLSLFNDTILLANEMNRRAVLPAQAQYDFLRLTVRPRKRFSKWFKKEDPDDLDTVKKAYNYSNEKAREALKILTSDQIKSIRMTLNPGGKC